MNKYIGIDLHSKTNVVVVTDHEDRIFFEKRLVNKLDEIKIALAPLCSIWVLVSFAGVTSIFLLSDFSMG